MLEPAAKKARFGDAGQAAEPAVLVDVPPPAQGWCTAMQPAREARQLLDTTLVVGEKRVEAHKLVLLSLSPYLNALFLSGFLESGADKGDVVVGDEHTDGSAVEAIVDCFYSGRLALSRGTVCSMIHTANMLQVSAIERAACDFFVENVEPETASEALAFAAALKECGAHGRMLYSRCLA